MTSINADQNVLQADERGRGRASKERREAVLNEFERSGLSGAKFARLAGIKYPTFMYWLKQRRAGRSNGSSTSVSAPRSSGFVEALIEGSSQRGSAGGLIIELSGGARVRVESPIQLQLAAELLGMLIAGGH